jgi:hypothetical protein
VLSRPNPPMKGIDASIPCFPLGLAKNARARQALVIFVTIGTIHFLPRIAGSRMRARGHGPSCQPAGAADD